MVKYQFIVVAYDIRDDKRREKICEILSQFGRRVNYSVFECILKKKEILELKRKIEKYVNKKEDTVLYYYLCQACKEKREIYGKPYPPPSMIKLI